MHLEFSTTVLLCMSTLLYLSTKGLWCFTTSDWHWQQACDTHNILNIPPCGHITCEWQGDFPWIAVLFLGLWLLLKLHSLLTFYQHLISAMLDFIYYNLIERYNLIYFIKSMVLQFGKQLNFMTTPHRNFISLKYMIAQYTGWIMLHTKAIQIEILKDNTGNCIFHELFLFYIYFSEYFTPQL